MRRKLLKAAKVFIVTTVILGTLVVSICSVEHFRGSISLAKYKRALAARGEAVTANDFLLPALEGTNGAPEVMQASGELVKGEVLPQHSPPRMRLTSSGRAIVGFRQRNWTEDKSTYEWNQLANDLTNNQPVLDRIRFALERPFQDNQLDYSQGPMMRFPHLMKAKLLSFWFGSSCQLALHENRLPDCLDSLIAEIHLPRFLERDRIVISELVRIALAAIARTDTWEALQARGWTDEQLARIQKAWEDQQFLANFTRSLEAERVFASITFDRCKKSNHEAATLLFWMEDFADPDKSQRPAWENALRAQPEGEAIADFLKKQVYCRLWRFAWLDQCELRYLKAVQQLVEVSRSAENSESWIRAQAQVDFVIEQTRNKSSYDSLRFPFAVSPTTALSHAVNKAMRAETERSLVLAAIALLRYQLQNTDPPNSLDLLVPRFLAAVPIDYMDGSAIKFILRTDGSMVLYSVGEDGIDDHGDNSLRAASTATATAWARKDFVWPQPASPEEGETNMLSQ